MLELKLKQLICLAGLLEIAIIQACLLKLALSSCKWESGGPEKGHDGGNLESNSKGLHVCIAT